MAAVKIARFRRVETDSLDDIAAMLEGRVFHVSKLAYLDAILRDGEIRTNVDGSLPTSFGFLSNGFFRKRDCVSLFDYRLALTDEIRGYRGKCSPLMPARPASEGVAILLMLPEIHTSLIPWSTWKDENACGDMIVPYVEVGHRGPIPLRMVEEIICLSLDEDPTSLAAILRRNRHTAG
ncbi:MAG: hypothetical protein Q8L95_07245 [Burkholderiales bacterium]|nr:hypothetical protein [Burkholderiales bacterium]